MFSTSDFLTEHNNLVPSGFNIFQATWDDSVSNTYLHILSEFEHQRCDIVCMNILYACLNI